jgi:predicted alpha/beta-fold hydrolase
MCYSFDRANKNIVLATVKHGGHLAFFEGITASSLWYLSGFVHPTLQYFITSTNLLHLAGHSNIIKYHSLIG